MTTISTLAQHLQMQDVMRNTRSELDRLSREVASGTAEDYFGHMGSDSGRGMALRNTLTQLEFFSQSADIAKTQLQGQQTSLDGIKTLAVDVRDELLQASGGPAGQGATVLSDGAPAFLEQVRGALNLAVGGRFVFSGPATDTPPVRDFTAANANGDSPQSVLGAIMAKYDLSTTGGMSAFLGEVHDVFQGTHANPNWTFDKVFYAGATGGSSGAVIDKGVEVSVDSRANAAGPRSVLEVLNVLRAVPVSATSIDSYQVLADTLGKQLTDAIDDTVDMTAQVGRRQETVNQTLERHDQAKVLLNNTVAGLEQVDGEAAASRLTMLQTQMEITYSLTARLNNLSLVHYL